MAQFRGTLEGNRGSASRLGTKNSGLIGTVNGWHVGLTLNARHDPDADTDRVSAELQGGSSGNNGKLPEIFIVADENGAYRIRLDGKIIAEKGDL